MKICKYCKTECDNSVNHCPSCGGTEFSYKCVNCGTGFESSHCPNCGVKFDAEPRVCPQCNTKYFTASCPNCGYNVNNSNKQTINVIHSTQTPPPQYVPVQKPKKKKVTILTVLLWIFFLPIMAIIAVWKSEKLDTKWKVVISVIIAVLTIVIGATGQTDSNTSSDTASSKSIWAAEVTPLKDFDYYIDGTEIHIKDYNGYNDKVRIANQYDVDGTKMNVVSLDGTFTLKSVDSVILPDGLKEVSDNCFNSCGVKYVYIPASLKGVSNDFWSYFHEAEKIYYGGTEAQWKKICKVDRGEVDVKQIVFNTKTSTFDVTTTKATTSK